ncbi:hypothetical protein BSLG_004538 [Batrachochytrium salamandrivorans]|nr:hypothetical protein BSLG_004538 [Batrachochytrium salamandrivorans]
MYQSCVLVSLLVTLFAPVFLHAPASFNPGVIPTKELSPWTGAYYIYLMVSVVPLAAMTSMRLPEASTQYTWAEYAFWGLPAITTLMIGYTAREMARVHIKIDELGDQKYELRGA